jgi:hypothetical protein
MLSVALHVHLAAVRGAHEHVTRLGVQRRYDALRSERRDLDRRDRRVALERQAPLLDVP